MNPLDLHIMHVIDPVWKTKEIWILRLQVGITCIALLLSVLGLLLVYPKAQRPSFQLPRLPKFDTAAVGQGPLSLVPPQLSPAARAVVQELMVIEVNSRPDQPLPSLTLGFKTSGEKIAAVMGQKLDLMDNVCLTPLSLQGEEVTMQLMIGTQMPEEFVMAPALLFRQGIEEKLYVQTLQAGQLWAFDQFLHQWGGEEYRPLSLKHKVQVGGHVYFLDVGDCLWWDGAVWRPGQHSDTPIAQLTASYDRGVQMGVWDEQGTAMVKVDIPLQSTPPIELNPNEMMKGVKVRSVGEIICQLGRRRVIVKEGDWWVKIGGRFRPLRSAKDLEAFLHHEIPGELVMFDKIETSQDRIVVQGRYFDRMRTKEEPLVLTLDSGKKPASLRTRQGGSSSLLAKNKKVPPQLARQSEEQP